MSNFTGAIITQISLSTYTNIRHAATTIIATVPAVIAVPVIAGNSTRDVTSHDWLRFKTQPCVKN